MFSRLLQIFTLANDYAFSQRITPVNLSDKWVQKNIRGRVYTGAIGLGMTIPALALLGFGESFIAVVGAGLLFGVGYGIFDANNMPILCQFISAKYRATAYGVMNMVGVFAGAAVHTGR